MSLPTPRKPLLAATRWLACALLILLVPAVAMPLAAAAPALQDDSTPTVNEFFSAMQWRNIGPFRGGRSVAVTGVVGDLDTYYFGSVGGGVWKTSDAGETWRNVSDGFLNTSSVGAIAVAESDANVVYVGMGEHAVRGVTTSHGDGVYRSTDAGKTWTHLGLDGTRAISRIRIHPQNPDLVYVAAQGAPYGETEDRGIYRSKDGGETWDKIHFVSNRAGASDLSMDMNNPRILYAAYWDHIRRPWIVESGGEGSGIWKSTDSGDTWTKIDKGLPELMGKVSVDVSRADSNRVYAIIEADAGAIGESGKGGLYRSDDAGDSWEQINSSRIIQTRSWYYMEVFADPQNADMVVVLNAPFMRSIDGGRTFENVQVPHGDNHDLWINPLDNNAMINANDGGANISFNGGQSWSTQRNQPTAQFYRVITDDQFPYHVYGGQQDNSAIGIASAAPGGPGWRDFYDVSGCESAYIAFDDPADPRYVYGTCIEGDIDVWDRVTRRTKPIRAYPEMNLGSNPIDQKYRFNWNNPVVGSPHARGVIYQAGNVLFRTSDRGQSWQLISPDLTRNDEEKQQIGGGPITNENAGGEVYNTIFYVTESPVTAGVIWAGTDDGLVKLTRDGGQTWSDVTPLEVAELGRGTGQAPGEALVNAIEASPHDAGTAYLAVSRYKFNDFTPHVFKTSDYGVSWTRVVDGIAADHWVRVVREDTVTRGLLYAGTELGIYVSFDDGDTWEPFNLNFPKGVAVTDLIIKDNDLVAATQGRSFWILDDLSPLQQAQHGVVSEPMKLFDPRPAYQVNWSGGFGFGPPRSGQNPPAGAQIFYSFGAPVPEVDGGSDEDMAAEAVTIEILDASGAVVRTYSSDTEAAEDASIDSLPEPATTAGKLHRLTWNFRHASVEPIRNFTAYGGPGGGSGGRLALPGTYGVRLTRGETSVSSELEVRYDPRVEVSTAELEAQDAFLADASEMRTAIMDSVNRMRDVRQQVQSVVDRTEDHADAETISEAGTALVESIDDWIGDLAQFKRETFQDMINFETQLITQVVALMLSVDGTEPPVTSGARERLADLRARWDASRAALGTLQQSVDAFNAQLRDLQVLPIIVGE